MFHSEIINDSDQLNVEMKSFVNIPVIAEVTHQQVMDNYFQIKYDIRQLINQEVSILVAKKQAVT